MTYKYWEHFKIEDDKIIFTIPETERLDKRMTKALGREFKSSEYISWETCNNHFIGINSISKEKRQQILEKWKSGGITIGETAKLFDTTSEIVGDVICFNIQEIPLLRRESI